LRFENQTYTRRRWLFAYAPLLIWIVVVIGFGSGLGAMNETSRFIRPLLEFLFPSAAPETIAFVHGYIRKGAHLFEYATLAILAMNAFNVHRRRVVIALTIVLAVATVDEFNQSFNPARTGTPFDVLLDLVGGSIGAGLWWLFAKFRGRRVRPLPEPLV
jgi:VanZ family protein